MTKRPGHPHQERGRSPDRRARRRLAPHGGHSGMITLDTARVRDALAPLHAELLRRADVEADRILADANAEARDVLDRARKRGANHHRQCPCRRRGAGFDGTDRRTRAHATCASKRDPRRAAIAYEQLRRRATDAVPELRDEPGYPGLRDRLAARAVEVLGTDAVSRPRTRPAASLPRPRAVVSISASTAFAARAFERIEADIDGLWS